MKTEDQIAAEAAKVIRERFGISETAALHGSLQSIIRFAITEAHEVWEDFLVESFGGYPTE